MLEALSVWKRRQDNSPRGLPSASKQKKTTPILVACERGTAPTTVHTILVYERFGRATEDTLTCLCDSRSPRISIGGQGRCCQSSASGRTRAGPGGPSVHARKVGSHESWLMSSLGRGLAHHLHWRWLRHVVSGAGSPLALDSGRLRSHQRDARLSWRVVQADSQATGAAVGTARSYELLVHLRGELLRVGVEGGHNMLEGRQRVFDGCFAQIRSVGQLCSAPEGG